MQGERLALGSRSLCLALACIRFGFPVCTSQAGSGVSDGCSNAYLVGGFVWKQDFAAGHLAAQ